jgi:hypothetical protein
VQVLFKRVVRTCGKVPAVVLVLVALGSMAAMEQAARAMVVVAMVVTDN